MNIEQYLAQEIKRFFPKAKNIVIKFEGETTIVELRYPKEDLPIVYECEPGSDDDWFVFRDRNKINPSFVILFPEEN